jgi:hypothetical protein
MAIPEGFLNWLSPNPGEPKENDGAKTVALAEAASARAASAATAKTIEARRIRFILNPPLSGRLW